MERVILRILLPLLLTAAAAAYERRPDLRAVEEAVGIGQSRDEAVRVRFHQPYRLRVGRPPVESIDVVTPFRRVELAAEERARTGDRLFRQRDALDALAEFGDTIKLFVEATFHPQNTYVGVPAYAVKLVRSDAPSPILARDEQRIPRFDVRVSGGQVPLPYPIRPSLPAGGEPIVGGTVIATFDGQRLDPLGTYDVVIEESGKELSRTRMDLGKLR